MSKKHKVTAIIYDRKGTVLSIGQNNYVKSHPLQAHHAAIVGQDYKIFLHAEIHAITRCANIAKAHSISIFRYNENGDPVLAKPCAICTSAIKATNIKKITHT